MNSLLSDMKLKGLLLKNRSRIVERWFEEVMHSYAGQTARIFGKNKDKFRNPVGVNAREGLDSLYDRLLGDDDPALMESALDQIIRIRSLQDFSASQAVSFAFSLKGIIRKSLAGDIQANNLDEQMCRLENRIDRMALVAFDIYSQCREKLYQIRVDQARSMYRMIDRPVGGRTNREKKSR